MAFTPVLVVTFTIIAFLFVGFHLMNNDSTSTGVLFFVMVIFMTFVLVPQSIQKAKKEASKQCQLGDCPYELRVDSSTVRDSTLVPKEDAPWYVW